jgi:Mn-dependent DtxR family transcriptional regulator
MNQSVEDYLRTIHTLSEQGKSLRSIEISKSLGVSKPSVSAMIKKLDNLGYVIKKRCCPESHKKVYWHEISYDKTK